MDALKDKITLITGAGKGIHQVENDFSRIDRLINHAAVEPNIPLLEMDEWDWHSSVDVNLTDSFLMTQSVGRVMRAQGSGVMINVITQFSGVESGQNKAAFIASMRGLDGFTRQAGRELSPYGIQV